MPGSADHPTGQDTVEPFSDRSRAALEAATRALIANLTGYLEAVRDIPTELSDEEKDDLVLPPDETVLQAVRAWNNAAGDARWVDLVVETRYPLPPSRINP